jgi:hypothetical protein
MLSPMITTGPSVSILTSAVLPLSKVIIMNPLVLRFASVW